RRHADGQAVEGEHRRSHVEVHRHVSIMHHTLRPPSRTQEERRKAFTVPLRTRGTYPVVPVFLPPESGIMRIWPGARPRPVILTTGDSRFVRRAENACGFSASKVRKRLLWCASTTSSAPAVDRIVRKPPQKPDSSSRCAFAFSRASPATTSTSPS